MSDEKIITFPDSGKVLDAQGREVRSEEKEETPQAPYFADSWESSLITHPQGGRLVLCLLLQKKKEDGKEFVTPLYIVGKMTDGKWTDPVGHLLDPAPNFWCKLPRPPIMYAVPTEGVTG